MGLIGSMESWNFRSKATGEETSGSGNEGNHGILDPKILEGKHLEAGMMETMESWNTLG